MTGRRRLIPLAVAAAVVVAGAFVLRSTQPSQPQPAPLRGTASTTGAVETAGIDFATARWAWTNVRGLRPATIAVVANGYIGACTADGLPAVCTSRDALAWTLPADPGVFSVSGDGGFTGWQVAHSRSNWVAASPIDGGVWHSSDGINWSPVAIGVAAARAEVQTLGTGFALFAGPIQNPNGGTDSALLLSADGVSWDRASLPVGAVRAAPAGVAGVFAFGEGENRLAWVSKDGMEWIRATPPNLVAFDYEFNAVVELPSGGFVGQFSSRPGLAGGFFVSADGVDWRASDVPGRYPANLVRAGGHFLTTAQVPGSDLTGFFESTDGVTWTRAAVLDGSPLMVEVDRNAAAPARLESLGERIALFREGRLAAIGRRVPDGVPLPAMTSSPSPSRSPAPSLQPFVAAGWRWHPLNVVPDYPPVRLRNGYLAECGTDMCTSRDGWTWQSPADPTIFSAEGLAHFAPGSIAHRPGGNWVMTASAGVWYSPDGVHWKPGVMPRRSIDSVLASTDGFAAHVYTDESVDYVYLSPDGIEWTRSSLSEPIYMEAREGTGVGWMPIVGAKFNYMWTPDGRHWTRPVLPANAHPGKVYRLASGDLVTAEYSGRLLRSKDGVTWTYVGPARAMTDLIVVQDRIIRYRDDGPRQVLESSDGGRSFHVLFDEATVAQFGDLLLVTLPGGAKCVGVPLTAEERATTTPTPTGPKVTPAPYVPPTREPAPAGGISKGEALRIAVAAAKPTADVAASASAAAVRDEWGSGRWIWSVNFTDDYQGPLNARGRIVQIDYFTGEILRILNWIS